VSRTSEVRGERLAALHANLVSDERHCEGGRALGRVSKRAIQREAYDVVSEGPLGHGRRKKVGGEGQGRGRERGERGGRGKSSSTATGGRVSERCGVSAE